MKVNISHSALHVEGNATFRQSAEQIWPQRSTYHCSNCLLGNGKEWQPEFLFPEIEKVNNRIIWAPIWIHDQNGVTHFNQHIVEANIQNIDVFFAFALDHPKKAHYLLKSQTGNARPISLRSFYFWLFLLLRGGHDACCISDLRALWQNTHTHTRFI